jgi:hypothetical protein
MNYRRLGVLLFSIVLWYFPKSVYADYVLPYPSAMPGNKLYTVTRIIDRAKKPLYFGSISRFKYHLSLADKYLVEAKTLFEYKQYLLAVDALERSNQEFREIAPQLRTAYTEGKDIRGFVGQLAGAIGEHRRVLSTIKQQVPDSVLWTPEKAAATPLLMGSRIEQAIGIRNDAERELR